MRKTCAQSSSQAAAEVEQARPATQVPLRMLRYPQVRERVALSRSTIWRLIQRGDFPKPIRLAGNAVGWREDLVDRWLRQRCAQ